MKVARDAGGVLIVRPSSLGDIVYALAVVSDIRRERPALAVDWVAEQGFMPLIAMCPDVRRVIPFGLRGWRKSPFAASTWRAIRTFAAELRRTRYDALLDLQEQVKGALIARGARGPRHGFDRASIREPLAALFDNVHHRVPRDLHFVERCRRLAAAALGYRLQAAPVWNLQVPATVPAQPARPYVVALHGTSRDDKLWPEERWRSVLASCDGAGFATVLPWGSAAEEARSHRLAQGLAHAVVPPWLSLPDAAALVSRAALVVGVDTGFTHLAAALCAPTVALFSVTEPSRHGVECAGPHARDLGAAGAPPGVDEVLAAAGALLREAPRC